MLEYSYVKESNDFGKCTKLKEYRINANTYTRSFQFRIKASFLQNGGREKHNTNRNFSARHLNLAWRWGWVWLVLDNLVWDMAVNTSGSYLLYILLNKHGQELGLKRQEQPMRLDYMCRVGLQNIRSVCNLGTCSNIGWDYIILITPSKRVITVTNQ